MATTTAIAGTAYNVTTTWDTGVVPTALDDVIIGAFNVTVPAGYTAQFLTITMTGIDAANRAQLTINGKLNLSGDITLNSYNELILGGNFEIELNGNNIYWVNSGALINKITSNTTEITRGKITSSVGGAGDLLRQAGTVQVGGSLNYIDFISTGVVNIASNFFAGDDFEALYNVFYDCQKITLGGYREGSNSIRVERNDFRATRDAVFMCILSSRLQGAESGGTQSFRFNTFSQGDGTRRGARFEYQADSSDCIFDDVEIYNVLSNSTDRIKTCDRIFSHISTAGAGDLAGGIGAGGGLGSTMIGALITSRIDNPKIWSQASPFGEISNCLYDPTYELGYTDGGDAILLSRATETSPNLIIKVTGNLVLETQTGAFINGLGLADGGVGAGNEITGGVLLEHNTLVGSYDNAYGGLLRTESGGYLTGDNQINSNLIVDRSANAGSLGFNLDFALDDQLTAFDYNNWFQIENPYQGVTSATKAAGVTVGFGGNDSTDDPQFFDDTRDFRQWDLLVGSGAGTTLGGTGELLKLNGYDDALKTQDNTNRTVHSVTSAISWMSDGYRVQNQALENAGHDGVTIGALAYFTALTASLFDFRRGIIFGKSQMNELRKYSELLTSNKAVPFSLYKQDGLTYATSATVTFAAGDVLISKNGGAFANTANLPVAVGSGWHLILTAAELTAARIRILISDATATQVWLDSDLTIETYGHASAMHQFDFGIASVAQTGDGFSRLSDYRLGELMSESLASQPIAESLLGDMTQDDPDNTGTQQFSIGSLDRMADIVLTGATHNIQNSLGKRIRQLQDSFIVDTGTAQAATTNTITLAATASASNNIYRGDRVVIVSGAGASEHGLITSYDGATKVATMSEDWVVIPDNTSTYDLMPATVNVDTWSHQPVSVSSVSKLPRIDLASVNDVINDAAILAQRLTDILGDTNELQSNQGLFVTATGFATDAALTAVQNDLNKLTGADGATLASLQPNYAPNTVIPDEAGTAPTVSEITADIDANSTKLAEITSARMSELDASTSGKMANEIDLIKAVITNIENGTIKKNTAGATIIRMFDSTTGNPLAAGIAVTGVRALDTGAYASMTATISVTGSKGNSHIAWTAADANGTKVVSMIFSAAGADDVELTLQLT